VSQTVLISFLFTNSPIPSSDSSRPKPEFFTPPERKTILKKAASILRKRRSDFARLLTLEMGKLLQEAGGEVDLSADILEYYADNAEKFLAPRQLKVDEGEAIVENAPWV